MPSLNERVEELLFKSGKSSEKIFETIDLAYKNGDAEFAKAAIKRMEGENKPVDWLLSSGIHKKLSQQMMDDFEEMLVASFKERKGYVEEIVRYLQEFPNSKHFKEIFNNAAEKCTDFSNLLTLAKIPGGDVTKIRKKFLEDCYDADLLCKFVTEIPGDNYSIVNRLMYENQSGTNDRYLLSLATKANVSAAQFEAIRNSIQDKTIKDNMNYSTLNKKNCGINASMLDSKVYRCGGYHGHGGQFNAEQTALGNYVYFIDQVIGRDWDYIGAPSYLNSDYYDGAINLTVDMLEKYVLENCVNKQNSTVDISTENFIKYFKLTKFESNSQTFKQNFGLFPYVAQYILMQNGIHLNDEKFVMDLDLSYDRDKSYFLNIPFHYGEKVRIEDTVKSIYDKNNSLGKSDNEEKNAFYPGDNTTKTSKSSDISLEEAEKILQATEQKQADEGENQKNRKFTNNGQKKETNNKQKMKETKVSVKTIVCDPPLKFGKTEKTSFDVALDENGNIDLTNPANARFLRCPQYMKRILSEEPQAYGTMPPEAFFNRSGSRVTRQCYLRYAQEGALERLNGTREIDIKNGNELLSKSEYAEHIIQTVNKKDNELIAKFKSSESEIYQYIKKEMSVESSLRR